MSVGIALKAKKDLVSVGRYEVFCYLRTILVAWVLHPRDQIQSALESRSN